MHLGLLVHPKLQLDFLALTQFDPLLFVQNLASAIPRKLQIRHPQGIGLSQMHWIDRPAYIVDHGLIRW
jgi:hypothetical protein